MAQTLLDHDNGPDVALGHLFGDIERRHGIEQRAEEQQRRGRPVGLGSDAVRGRAKRASEVPVGAQRPGRAREAHRRPGVAKQLRLLALLGDLLLPPGDAAAADVRAVAAENRRALLILDLRHG